MSGSDGFSDTIYQQLCKEGSAKSTLVLVGVILASLILVWIMCRLTEENGWPEDITFFHDEVRDNKRFKAPRGFNRERPCHTWESDSDEPSMEFGNLER